VYSIVQLGLRHNNFRKYSGWKQSRMDQFGSKINSTPLVAAQVYSVLHRVLTERKYLAVKQNITGILVPANRNKNSIWKSIIGKNKHFLNCLYFLPQNSRSNSGIFRLKFWQKSISGSCVAGIGINIWNYCSVPTRMVKIWSGSCWKNQNCLL
jgi:hypothetical protein